MMPTGTVSKGMCQSLSGRQFRVRCSEGAAGVRTAVAANEKLDVLDVFLCFLVKSYTKENI